MNRYNNLNIKKTFQGKKYFNNPIYPSIPESLDDIYVETEFGDRTDILAHQFYNNPSLWWVITIANPNKLRRDSYVCKEGLQIRIPLNPEPIVRAYNRLNSNR